MSEACVCVWGGGGGLTSPVLGSLGDILGAQLIGHTNKDITSNYRPAENQIKLSDWS